MFMSIIAWIAMVQAVVCILMYSFLFIKVNRLSHKEAAGFFNHGNWDILRPHYLYHASQIFTKNLLFYMFFILLFYWWGQKAAMIATTANMVITNMFYSCMLKKYVEVTN